jgi:hypothetical protein
VTKSLLLCVTKLAPVLRPLHSWHKGKKTVRTVGTELKVCMETRTVVMQELFDEVYMGEDHTSTAVSLKLQFIQGVTGEPTRR